jgi:hypothetical protein
MTHELNTLGQTNWCTTVKNILEETNNTQLWNTQNITEKQYAQLKENLYKNFMASTMAQIDNSDTNPKLRTYKLFKGNFQFESYLSSPTNLNHVIALAKFRISSHNLAIETGRYTKPKTAIDDRLCINCNLQEVESEKHFLLICPLYNDDRKILMDSITPHIHDLENLSNEDKFIRIMSNKERHITDAVGRFVAVSFNKRNHNTVKID